MLFFLKVLIFYKESLRKYKLQKLYMQNSAQLWQPQKGKAEENITYTILYCGLMGFVTNQP